MSTHELLLLNKSLPHEIDLKYLLIMTNKIKKSINHISLKTANAKLKTTNINPICNDIISACDRLQKLA
jgi:hypothetical protein